MAGYARTVRYLPLREDLMDRYAGLNAQEQAIEEIQPGEVLVIEARGDTTAGTIGDILALRAQVRAATGIVTDGAIRDSAAITRLDIPAYHAAAHPAVLGRRHVPWESPGSGGLAHPPSLGHLPPLAHSPPRTHLTPLAHLQSLTHSPPLRNHQSPDRRPPDRRKVTLRRL